MADCRVEWPKPRLGCGDRLYGKPHMQEASACAPVARKIDADHLRSACGKRTDQIGHVFHARSPAVRHKVTLPPAGSTAADPVGMRPPPTRKAKLNSLRRLQENPAGRMRRSGLCALWLCGRRQAEQPECRLARKTR